MSSLVFATVLFAALLHAMWNALVKGGKDKAASMVAVVIGQGLAGGLLLPFAPPMDWSCWPYLAAGVVLHLGYQIFLIQAYKIGDLTQVYPIARGVSPLLVALGTAVFFGVTFSFLEMASLLLISIGIASIALVRQSSGSLNLPAAGLALVTGMFIAGYSMVDGQGARIAGTALGFFGSLAVVNALLFTLGSACLRTGLVARALQARRALVIGGGASFAAYVLVVWAFTQAPIALVTALRETSIIFALFIGVIFLRERLDLAKVCATAMTLSGAVLLRFVRE